MWIKIGEAFKDFLWKIGAQKQQIQKTSSKLAEGSLFCNSTNVYLFQVINRNSRKRCEICLKLIKYQNDVIDVILVFLLLTLNIFDTFF